MADRIVLNTISYHGHGAIENIVPELTARGYKKAFVCSDPVALLAMLVISTFDMIWTARRPSRLLRQTAS